MVKYAFGNYVLTHKVEICLMNESFLLYVYGLASWISLLEFAHFQFGRIEFVNERKRYCFRFFD